MKSACLLIYIKKRPFKGKLKDFTGFCSNQNTYGLSDTLAVLEQVADLTVEG
jgi:hypothetical protein